jgi:hypothetical protein
MVAVRNTRIRFTAERHNWNRLIKVCSNAIRGSPSQSSRSQRPNFLIAGHMPTPQIAAALCRSPVWSCLPAIPPLQSSEQVISVSSHLPLLLPDVPTHVRLHPSPTVSSSLPHPALSDLSHSTNVYDRGDLSFIIIAGAMVFFMVPGLAFLYSGLSRRKNARTCPRLPQSRCLTSQQCP